MILAKTALMLVLFDQERREALRVRCKGTHRQKAVNAARPGTCAAVDR
jgi:hypothetical protein